MTMACAPGLSTCPKPGACAGGDGERPPGAARQRAGGPDSCFSGLTACLAHAQVVTVNDYLARRDSEWVGQPRASLP